MRFVDNECMKDTTPAPPSPQLFFDTVNAYQRTAAIKGAVELDFFTAMADGPATAKELARHCGTAERGARILADYLTIQGFLTKCENQYGLTPDSAMFLNRKSPAYAGGMIQFLPPELRRGSTISVPRCAKARRKASWERPRRSTQSGWNSHAAWRQ
jgi:hypothetical protein